MAQSKHHLLKYDEAAFFYKQYLKEGDTDSKQYQLAMRELKNCVYAAFTQQQTRSSLVQSFGPEVNSAYDEICPVQSPSYGNLFYFSSNRNTKDFDILAFSLSSEGKWKIEDTSHNVYNNIDNNIIQHIAGNGSALLYLDYNYKKQRLIPAFSVLDKDGNEQKIELPESIFKNAVDIQIIDRNTLAFSSKELNGFGGYDIYTLSYQAGNWQSPVNAGPDINSEFDERSPFYSQDLKQLYFSSNKPYCYGGYDVYYCSTDGLSASPVNLGSNINSPGDELHLKMDETGHMAVFSSDRKTGLGGFDIYFIYMEEIRPMGHRDTLEFAFVEDQLAHITVSDYTQPQQTDISLDSINKTSQKNIELDDVKEPDTEFTPDTIVIASVPENEKLKAPLTIYYEDRFDVLKAENKLKLNKLSGILNTRDFYIHLVAHTNNSEPGLPEYVQYNTLKRAISVADYLVESGVAENRISIESVAANYPLIKDNIAGQEIDSLLRLNKRIELQLLNNKKEIISEDSILEMTEAPEYAWDRQYELYKSIKDGLYFSVEIARTDRIFKNAILRLYNDIYIRREQMDSPNKYYIGIYTNIEDVINLKNELAKSSAPYAKIEAFYKGQIVHSEDYKSMSKKYPQFKLFANAAEKD
jgi:outer membrane protein OmpA-like peptidoglycan-associated protein